MRSTDEVSKPVKRRQFLSALAVLPWIHRSPGRYYNPVAAADALVANGTTDNMPRLRSLVTAGAGPIHLPAGRYLFDLTNQPPIQVPDGVQISGDRGTVIQLRTTTAGACNFLDLFGNHVALRNLRIEGNFAAGTIGHVISFAGQGGQVSDVEIDLGDRDVPGSSLHLVSAFYPAAHRPSDHWSFTNVTVDRVQRAFFRTNLDTAEHNDMTFTTCTFRGSQTELFVFNSPVSRIRRPLVDQCVFEGNPLRHPSVLLLGMTGTTGGVVRRCRFSGPCVDAVHIEQDTDTLLIDDCDFTIQGNGVKILSDDVGGRPASPSGITVRGSRFRGASAPVGQRGRAIWCVWDASGRVAATSVAVLGNTVDGFDMAVDFGNVPAGGVRAEDNMIRNCTVAFRALVPSLGIIRNTMQQCQVGFASRTRGAWARQTVEGCTSPAAIQ